MATKCFHPTCAKRFPKDALFRINEKGVPGIWACREHMKNTDRKPDPAVERIVGIIEGSAQRRGNEQ